MSKISPSHKIYILRSKIINGGRGVFSKTDINKGEIIEICPVIAIPHDHAPIINESMLVTYVYYLGKNKDQLVLALGCGSIYNHSHKPNARYVGNYKAKTIKFVAIKKIKKNEEICVDYKQGNNKNDNPLWFESE